MSDKAAKAYELYKADVGKDEGAGDWMEITQQRINDFADVTLDHQFIHIDPERAKTTPFGTTIAHGFLTLSLIVHLDKSIPKSDDPARYDGILMGVNYGFEKVRFPAPVKVGKRIRARAKLIDVELKGPWIQLTRQMTVEIEGEEKPAVVADWLTRAMYS